MKEKLDINIPSNRIFRQVKIGDVIIEPKIFGIGKVIKIYERKISVQFNESIVEIGVNFQVLGRGNSERLFCYTKNKFKRIAMTYLKDSSPNVVSIYNELFSNSEKKNIRNYSNCDFDRCFLEYLLKNKITKKNFEINNNEWYFVKKIENWFLETNFLTDKQTDTLKMIFSKQITNSFILITEI